jgi:hypothetical protein
LEEIKSLWLKPKSREREEGSEEARGVSRDKQAGPQRVKA